MTVYRKIAFAGAAAVLAASFAVSAAFSRARGEDGRKIFYFPDSEGRIFAETRRLPESVSGDGPLSGPALAVTPERFVEELLLGPESPRFKALFNTGTRAVSCFVGGDTLYVNLSAHALFPDGTTCSIREGAELLARNVTRNFGRISRVSLFIGGRKAFAGADER